MGRLTNRTIINDNKNCLFLFEAQTGDATLPGNRARGFIDGRFISSTAPTLDTGNKKWGSQSVKFDYATSTFCKFYRNIAKTITTVPANNQFTIASDYTDYFIVGKIITITGATSNNGTYTVVSSSFSVVTTVTIAETTLSVGGTLGTVGHVNPITLIGTGDFTVEAVFKTPASWVGSYHDVCGCDYSGNFALEVITSTPYLVFWVGGSIKTALNPIATDTWYEFLAVRKNGVLKIWVEGILRYSAANTYSIVANNDFYVGDDGDTLNAGYEWDSNIQRVGFWKNAQYWHPGTTTGKKHFDNVKYMKNIGAIKQQ